MPTTVNALDALYLPLALVTAPAWAFKRRQGWRERFGKVRDLPPPTRPRLLLHAVSVGEVSALRHLVPLLTPHADVVISATTDTGYRRACELFDSVATITRYPLDFSGAVRRFLDSVKPTAVALVELEVWPNFVDECRRRGIPVSIISGRLSARSFKGYRRIRGFFSRRLAGLRFIAAQDQDYAQRFIDLGADPASVQVLGSMKWDAARIELTPVYGSAQLADVMGIDTSRPIIVAGSTGPGEEAMLHAACPPGVQLVCAPRKPERFDEAARALPGCVRLSLARANSENNGSRSSYRFLIDTIGDLRKAYSLATVVVVGRSFGSLFGSDPIEPIALGKPTLIGPAHDDFAQIVAAFQKHQGILVCQPGDLAETLLSLATEPARGAALAKGGREAILANQGASAAQAKLLLTTLLPQGVGTPTMAQTTDVAAASRK